MWVLPLVLVGGLSVLGPTVAETSTPNTGDQTQAFTFAYTTSNLVLPVTSACPTPLTLTQLTTTNANGPDPVAPYTMVLFIHEQLMDGAGVRYERIYTRSMDVGSLSETQEIQHPWMNGSQFIGCIWASNGVSGGCQDLFTVVPSYLSAAAYENATSECRTTDVMGSWVTSPSNTLDVQVQGTSGTVAWNAWPKACTDLKFTPKNGTGPYTLVIAPAAHPPVNITSTGSGSMNYTVRLTHGQAFFAGIFDSAGNSWAFGPLHSGDSDDLECLAVATGQTLPGNKRRFSLAALAGGTGGAFIAGALGAAAVLFFFGKRRAPKVTKPRRSESQELLDPYADPRPLNYRVNSGTSSLYPLSIHQPYTDGSPQPGGAAYESPLSTLDYSPQPDGRGYSRPPSDPFIQSYSKGGGGGSGAGGGGTGIEMADFHPSGPSSREHTGSPGGGGGSRGRASGSRGSGERANGSGWGGGSGGGSGNGSGPRGRGRMPSMLASPSPRRRSMEWDDLSSDEEDDARGERHTRKVYVVHSDGGGNVHIQLPDAGARVVELPPTYRNDPPMSPRMHSFSPPPRSPLAGQAQAYGQVQGYGQGHEYGPEHAQQGGDDAFMLPYLELEPIRSHHSGLSEVSMSEAELRARAEAALAEKARPLSGASQRSPPR